jgi:hypothetical protein
MLPAQRQPKPRGLARSLGDLQNHPAVRAKGAALRGTEQPNDTSTEAKGGDMAAARLVLDRIWPAARGRALKLDLPSVADAAGINAAHTKLLQNCLQWNAYSGGGSGDLWASIEGGGG